MDSWRTFQPRRLSVITTEGTLEQKESGLVDWPSNRVGASRDGSARMRGNPIPSFLESTGKKSFSWEFKRASVP